MPGPNGSEQPLGRVVHASQRVIVHHRTGDPAVGGEDPGLWLDLLGREDPADGPQLRVSVEQLEVAGELLDAVDLAATLDLDRNRAALAVAAHQVDRPDGGGVLTPYQGQAVGQRRRVVREEL